MRTVVGTATATLALTATIDGTAHQSGALAVVLNTTVTHQVDVAGLADSSGSATSIAVGTVTVMGAATASLGTTAAATGITFAPAGAVPGELHGPLSDLPGTITT